MQRTRVLSGYQSEDTRISSRICTYVRYKTCASLDERRFAILRKIKRIDSRFRRMPQIRDSVAGLRDGSRLPEQFNGALHLSLGTRIGFPHVDKLTSLPIIRSVDGIGEKHGTLAFANISANRFSGIPA